MERAYKKVGIVFVDHFGFKFVSECFLPIVAADFAMNDMPVRGVRIDFNRRKIEAAWRIMISRQWGIESTKADSARGSTVACTSGSVIAVLAWLSGSTSGTV